MMSNDNIAVAGPVAARLHVLPVRLGAARFRRAQDPDLRRMSRLLAGRLRSREIGATEFVIEIPG